MSELRSAGILQPLAVAGLHENLITDGEHALSIQVSRALFTLEAFRRHSDRYSDDKLPSDDATRIRVAVEETYHTYFGSVPKREASDDEYDHDDGYREPYERETRAIEGALRDIWHQNYYEPRSHPTTKDEFQEWLNAYVDRYGMAAIAKTKRSSASFDGIYRTFEFARGNDKDLRTAETDLLLIQGCGAAAISTLEAPGTSVQMAIPKVWHHNKIYSVGTDPEQWFGQIAVPSDIIRRLGGVAATDGFLR